MILKVTPAEPALERGRMVCDTPTGAGDPDRRCRLRGLVPGAYQMETVR
ncbi:hypothetical protein SAMN06264365_107174 [Actinoplanes regularis]|uniref:Uncharacterized protein n=1 Tax=Actinoplanes regularis TaxID=52697 RepID=A0A239ABA8_9ACTN|nr:hypothetical protein SAMN06264365_107174 [Actinoplanes regularis]